jgi:tetrahydromethanopterin S-methyltransferase subunit F
MSEETKEEVTASISMQTDVSYIKRAVDDIKLDLRAQGQRLDALTERVVVVEESVKQAHSRIEELRQ